MLSFKKLFESKSLVQLITDISARDIKSDINDLKIDKELKIILYRMLQRNPEKRYNSALAILSDINLYLSKNNLLLSHESTFSLLNDIFKSEKEKEKKEIQEYFKLLKEGHRPVDDNDPTIFFNKNDTVIIPGKGTNFFSIEQLTSYLSIHRKKYIFFGVFMAAFIGLNIIITKILINPSVSPAVPTPIISPPASSVPELLPDLPETKKTKVSKTDSFAVSEQPHSQTKSKPVDELNIPTKIIQPKNDLPFVEDKVVKFRANPTIDDPSTLDTVLTVGQELPETSKILINGIPAVQTIYLDGQKKGGLLPLTLTVEPGGHLIECISELRTSPYKVSVYARKGIEQHVDCTVK
jgi:serine/threonine protein kinase